MTRPVKVVISPLGIVLEIQEGNTFVDFSQVPEGMITRETKRVVEESVSRVLRSLDFPGPDDPYPELSIGEAIADIYGGFVADEGEPPPYESRIY